MIRRGQKQTKSHSPGSKKWHAAQKCSGKMQSKYALVYPYLLNYLSLMGIKNLKTEESLKDLLGMFNQKQIVVISGTYDHIENIFKQSDIPHTLISVEDVLGFEFKTGSILFCNCTGSSYNEETNSRIRILLDSKVITTLVTTDWCGIHTLKGVLDQGEVEQIGTTGDHVCVDVNCSEYSMAFGKIPAAWWLECSSHVVTVKGSTPFMECAETLDYTTCGEHTKLERPKLSYKKVLPSGSKCIHFTSHLELQQNKGDERYKGLTLQEFVVNELGLELSEEIEKKITVSEFHSIFTSLMTVIGIFADHYAEGVILPRENPLPVSAETIDPRDKLRILGLTSLNQHLDTQRFHMEREVMELCDQIGDIEYVLNLTKTLRLKYKLNDFPLILLTWCIKNNSKQPEAKATLLREFCRVEFRLSIKDFISLYNKCHSNLRIPKVLQKIFSDRLPAFTLEDFRKFQGSPRYSIKYPVAPRECLKLIVKMSHVKPSSPEAPVNVFLGTARDAEGNKIKLPMVETVVTAKSSGEDPTVFLPRLIDEGKLSFNQMVLNLNDLMTCNQETISWVIRELHDVEKIRKSNVMISRYLKAINEHDDPRVVSALDNAAYLSVLNHIPDGLSENMAIYVDNSGSMNLNQLFYKSLAMAYFISKKYPNTEVFLVNSEVQKIELKTLKECCQSFNSSMGLQMPTIEPKYHQVIWISDTSSQLGKMVGDHQLTYIGVSGEFFYHPDVKYVPGSEFMNLELL
jgi:hypothetical protein